jgi:peptidoglycan hydrolase-like protein with peptidoglycan-binding domain
MKRFLLTAALLAASALPPACAQQGQPEPTSPAPPEQPSAADVTQRGATPGATASAAAAAAADLSLEQVRRIQQRLRELGFEPGPVDGIWGEQTRAALRAFQEARGLEPTGDPTEPTLAALGVEGGAGQEAAAATTGSGTEVTGLVTAVDEQAYEIVIDGQTYVMPEQSGTAMLPAEGDRVTLFYREEGGRRMITRIGQPRQQ